MTNLEQIEDYLLKVEDLIEDLDGEEEEYETIDVIFSSLDNILDVMNDLYPED